MQATRRRWRGPRGAVNGVGQVEKASSLAPQFTLDELRSHRLPTLFCQTARGHPRAPRSDCASESIAPRDRSPTAAARAVLETHVRRSAMKRTTQWLSVLGAAVLCAGSALGDGAGV